VAKRKSVSKSVRFEIFKRDGFLCQYCGAHPPAVVLVVDHIVPVAAGGGNEDDNLVSSCEPCNQGKAARSLTQVPQSLTDKATAVAEREAQLKGYHKIMEARRDRIEAESWNVAEVYMVNFGKDTMRKDHLTSIRNFNEKLGFYEVQEAMEKAVSRMRSQDQCFRYFCGICWRKIKESGHAE
jgi:hypothetical protein